MSVAPDRLAAGAVAGAALLAFAVTYSFEEVPPGLAQGLGAVEFPRLICLVLLGLAALLALGAQPRRPPPPVPGTGWASMALCLLFLPAMALIGMLPSMALFLLAMGLLWGERRIGLLVGTALGLTLAIWLVFVRLFGLSLPPGWLGETLLG
ncbi:tripartite tricarboxylate transporter TctB family protein [Pseudoroseomonas cervicalis]|uniref:tripartite tricarboxylate transporter TctB family protein n=1 Tax=Teichococcus cervicalis TaxID=204525 RepID=UPI002784A026|nr:tripartite tricarboxylate transporter TctB family protein [Pseudoroseomonas cervicalis]MDQ1081982.1 hypothetical protein [Pseudoroseomonas cervicalis]